MTEDDKTKVQLAKEKPIFIYSNFQEEKSFDDILGIEQLVDEQFREITAKGTDATVIFYETKKFPGAYRLRGQYRQVGDEIILQLNIFKGKTKQESLTINGNKNNLPEFVKKIIDSVQSEITN